ncbi:hypothetical protein CWB99_12165 [Pseudoalteromonas rubra]|uniref:Uncharacterized protein n=1 Tax=Pseudoalteromonas rubra TaxID=43658 RepID=A0A5S3WL26_9GAMM|nr:hypothetical protein [Pseudoalteromonas rubra]TMP28159.1 hypothetical protein CWB99_12165 [Pseudoalteromonas rubra]TMP34860.1 hypothetical protein CWC00_05795 [Pseudoalteromonas rubra]
MKSTLNTLLKVSSIIACSSMATAYAQDSSLMSCYWQVEKQNEVGIWERQVCVNPVDANLPAVLVASRVNIPSYGVCSINWLDGYRTELKGTVKVEGNKANCGGHAVSFEPAPDTRIVDGLEEKRLDCRWNNAGGNAHKLMCDDIEGRTLTMPIATKMQAAGSTECVMNFNGFTLNYFSGGVAVLDKKPTHNACDVGPVYFRAYPAQRMVDGFEETLLQCTWRDVNASARIKSCSNVGTPNKDVTVAIEVNGRLQSLIDTVNNQLSDGEIVEDNTLNPIYPALYFRKH